MRGAKRFFPAFFFLCGFFCFLTGCTRSSVSIPRDHLVIGLETAPLSMDPRLAADAYSSKLVQLTHNGLFQLNDKLEVEPDLVETYQILTPTKYLFHLRKGIRFHDGKLLTAYDVEYTMKSIQNPETKSPFSGTFKKIHQIEILGEHSLTIDLTEPFAPFLSVLTLGIVPEGRLPHIGTGPFFLKSFEPEKEVILERNETFFGALPQMKQVLFRVIPDDNLRVLEMINKKVDVLQNNVPVELLPALEKKDDVLIQSAPGVNYAYLGLNLREKPLSELKVRQALAYALDRKTIIDFRLARKARLAKGILPEFHWAHEKEMPGFDYHPALAKTLLDQAGYPDPDGNGPQSRFTLTYKTSTKRDRVGLARLIARYLKAVGIELKILPYEWGTLYHDINSGNFQMYSLTWVGVTEPDIYYYVFHSSQVPKAGGNRGFFSNKKVDALTEVGRRILNQTYRTQVYSTVQKMVAKEVPYVSLWHEDNVIVSRKNVQGIHLWPNASFSWVRDAYKTE